MNEEAKTIREWFQTLPEPYASQAIANSFEGNLNATVGSLFTALSCGFKYRRSPQGFEYWKSFQDEILEKEYQKKIQQYNGK